MVSLLLSHLPTTALSRSSFEHSVTVAPRHDNRQELRLEGAWNTQQPPTDWPARNQRQMHSPIIISSKLLWPLSTQLPSPAEPSRYIRKQQHR